MGRRSCCDKVGLKKGPWTSDEDQKLRDFIQTNGTKFCWRAVPQRAGLVRCGKSCRLRWTNYLRPGLKTDLLSEEEEKLVVDLHSQFGNKWSKIASHLPGRTDNYIKNYWHNHIKKKFRNLGIDSFTHKPLLPHPPTDDHHNTSRNKSRRSREDVHDEDEQIDETLLSEDNSINNLDLAVGILTTDKGFSVDDIPLIQPHEILIPPAVSDHLPSHICSPSSFPSTPSTSTTDISSSTINQTMNEKLESFQYWQKNDPCKDNINGNKDEGDFTYWDWLREPASY